MSIPANTHRLQRLARTTELRKQSIAQFNPTETLKLAAINSIKQSVKLGDTSLLTGRQLNKLRKQPEASADLEYTSAHQNLKAMRQKYDNIHTQRLQREEKVHKLREQMEKYKNMQDGFLGDVDLGKEKVDGLYGNLNGAKLAVDEADMQRKVLLNMKSRLKKDKIIYDQQQYDLNKEIAEISKCFKVLKAQVHTTAEEEDKAKKICERLVKHVSEEDNSRKSHIRNISEVIDDKRRISGANEMRGLEIREIAQRAMQDKDQNQKIWEKVFLTQKLLSRLLRDKMYREMDKFSTVENAFKNIKIATGINDSAIFTSKFLNKESAYGELLGRIAENETNINKLKQQSQQLRKQHKELEQEQKQLFQMRKKETHTLLKQNKELEVIEQRKLKTELLKNKLKTWATRNLKKFKLLGEPIQKIPASNSIEDITNLFKKYLEILSSQIEKFKEEDLIATYTLEHITPKLIDKIFRVKIISKRKNSIGQEINPEYEDEFANMREEEELVENQRLEVLRRNDKFMKELKKKYEQIKRAKIEAQPKQKKKAPQQKVQVVIEEEL